MRAFPCTVLVPENYACSLPLINQPRQVFNAQGNIVVDFSVQSLEVFINDAAAEDVAGHCPLLK